MSRRALALALILAAGCSSGQSAPPEAPKQEAESRVKAGPYDASTLPSNRPDRPGPYLAPDPAK